jgi:PilZ domain-containing protein
MGPTMKAVRIYVSEERQGVVTCVQCGVTRTLNLATYPDAEIGNKALRVKCSICNTIFRIRCDLRQYHRMDVHLPGKIFHAHAERAIDEITIISLSLGGVGFITNNNLQINDDDIYRIKFQLDDEERSIICEEIRIKRVDGRLVGAEFYQSDKYNYALDFYLIEASWDP